MTVINKIMVSIFRHGINNDDIGPIAKASFEETPEMFLKAAKHGELDNLKGVSANIMCGQLGYYGTNCFKLLIDNDFVINQDSETDLNSEKLLEKEFNLANFNNISQESTNCSTNNLKIDSVVNSIKNINMGQSDDYIIDF